MTHVITKKTKFNTKFKETNLFFLTELKRRLELKNWTNESQSSYVVCMATPDFPYCWDSISLIEKRMSKDGWVCEMTNYFRGENGIHSYTWRYNKK